MATGPGQRRLATAAKRFLTVRRLPERLLADGLVQDPGWDILLDLYAAQLDARCPDVSSLCLDKPGSITTALRRIHMLEANGLIQRLPDPNDRRRSFVSLRETASRQIEACLRDMLDILDDRPDG